MCGGAGELVSYLPPPPFKTCALEDNKPLAGSRSLGFNYPNMLMKSKNTTQKKTLKILWQLLHVTLFCFMQMCYLIDHLLITDVHFPNSDLMGGRVCAGIWYFTVAV